MKFLAKGSAVIRLLTPLVVAALLLSAVVAVVMASSHRSAVASAETLEQSNAARSDRDWARFEARVAKQSKVVAKQTARDRVAADRAARKQKVRRAVIQRAAALKEAARQQAVRDKVAREEAARAAAAQAVADRRAAVKAEAARKVAAEKAALRRTARRAAIRAARQVAVARAAASHIIAGRVTAPSVVGALVARVGDYPGQPWSALRARQRTRVRAMMAAVDRGRTYACPAGAGGRYRAFAVGTRVKVRDGRGDIVSVSTLTGGRIDGRGCTFAFRATVPNAQLYKVRVAAGATVDYTRRTLAADRWRIAMRLA